MAGREFKEPVVRQCGDVILYQRIDGGWEYQYLGDSESYRGFHRDPAPARMLLLRQLGWDRQRFERAEFRRF